MIELLRHKTFDDYLVKIVSCMNLYTPHTCNSATKELTISFNFNPLLHITAKASTTNVSILLST